MPAANWRRPEYYAKADLTREQAIETEVRAVRDSAGLIDVGTLGKIKIYGPRAGAFLDRIYTSCFSNLAIGKTRYALMTDELGTVVDDGIVARLAEQVFYFTTTTSNSTTVYRELLRLATWWGEPVGLVNLTGHFGAFNLAGPHSRDILQRLTTLDLSGKAFPYLAVRCGAVAGCEVTIMRVGFVGELGYEIHMRATDAAPLWNALTDAGRGHDLKYFGVEAQRLLRLEKGHLIVGQDTDGLTNPFQIGASALLKLDKAHFVGQRSLQILANYTVRQRLVGFEVADNGAGRLLKESHLVIEAGEIAGRVTSVAYSPTLKLVIGLAMIDSALIAAGRFNVRAAYGQFVRAHIVPTPFYDPLNARQKMDASNQVAA